MMWNQRRHTKLVPYDPVTNIPRFRVNPGCNQHRVFEAIFNETLTPEEQNICYHVETRTTEAIPSQTPEDDGGFIDKYENLVDFMVEKVHVNEQEEAREELLTPQSELIQWHYMLGHCSFHKLRSLAASNIPPKRLVSVRCPKCAGCEFSAMAKKPWRI